MCIGINISEKGRVQLAVVITVLNALMAICGLLVISMAIYLKIHVDDKIMLLENYDPGMLTHFLISIGTLLILLNSFGAKMASDCSSLDTRGRFRSFMLAFIVLMFCFSWVVFAGGIVCFTHKSTVEDALHSGILTAMRRYKTEQGTKVTIDKLQMKTKCCGSRSYRDWFKTGWINTDYLDLKHPAIASKMNGEDFLSDEVPFSCCDYRSRRPCVHHKVENKNAHVMYDEVTLYNRGCTTALIEHFEDKLLQPAGTTVMVLFGVELLSVILLRYLQTSIQKAYLMGDPSGEAVGYVFPPFSETGDPVKLYEAGALEGGGGGDGGGGGGGDDDDDGGDGGGDDGGGGGGGGGDGGGKSKKEKGKKDKGKKDKGKKDKKKSKGKKSSKKSPKRSPRKSPKRSKMKKSPKRKSPKGGRGRKGGGGKRRR